MMMKSQNLKPKRSTWQKNNKKLLLQWTMSRTDKEKLLREPESQLIMMMIQMMTKIPKRSHNMEVQVVVMTRVKMKRNQRSCQKVLLRYLKKWQ